MQETLNRKLADYGVRITGANIPDVQLPQQYQDNMSTREKVAKELNAYEKEWELIRKRRNDELLLEIERAKKEREAKLIGVQEAGNKAREDVAQMLQKKEAEAEKIRLEIEAEGRAKLKSAENEAKALHRLGRSYKDNQAVLHYQLAVRQLEVAEHLVHEARKYIFAERGGIYLIDLKKTLRELNNARDLVHSVVQGGGSVLFVCTKPQLSDVVRAEAERCGSHYVTERWLGGMLTNFQTIKKNIRRLKELERGMEENAFEFYTKKEKLLMDRERTKLDRYLSGIKDMGRLPRRCESLRHRGQENLADPIPSQNPGHQTPPPRSRWQTGSTDIPPGNHRNRKCGLPWDGGILREWGPGAQSSSS
jgi:hypothetical protein